MQPIVFAVRLTYNQSVNSRALNGMSILREIKTRRVIFAVLLALLLVTAATAGSVWHHHATQNAESSCPICHLGHQTAQLPAIVQSAPATLAACAVAAPLELFVPDGAAISQQATRAPPSL